MAWLEKTCSYIPVFRCRKCRVVCDERHLVCCACGYEGSGTQAAMDAARKLPTFMSIMLAAAQKPEEAAQERIIARPVLRRRFPKFWRWRVARWEEAAPTPTATDAVDALITETAQKPKP